jgi:hypothetical protein
MARPGLRPHRARGGGGGGSTGDTGRPRRRLRRRLRGERGPAYRGAGEREAAALPGGGLGSRRRVLSTGSQAAAPSALPRPGYPSGPRIPASHTGSSAPPAGCAMLSAPKGSPPGLWRKPAPRFLRTSQPEDQTTDQI